MQKIKNVIFLGRKPSANRALQYLFDSNINIQLIVTKKKDIYTNSIIQFAKKNKIKVFHNDKKIYQLIEQNDKLIQNIDLVISFLYWKRIRYPLIKLGKYGCINFHPAPLPEYKGRAGYNTAILENKKYFGVSAHFINNEEFDNGPIIKVKRFKMSDSENAFSLEQKTQKELLKLFKHIMKKFIKREIIKTTKNIGGLYLNKKQIEEQKFINPKEDSLKIIDRKIRAFFYPPYTGASIQIKGKIYTLINEDILNYINKKLRVY